MKRLISLLMVGIVCLSLAACGHEDPVETKQPEIPLIEDALVGTWFQIILGSEPGVSGRYYCLKVEFFADGTYKAKTVMFDPDEIGEPSHANIRYASTCGSMLDSPEDGFYSREGSYIIGDGTIELVCEKVNTRTGSKDRESIILKYEYKNLEYFLSFVAGNGELFKLAK